MYKYTAISRRLAIIIIECVFYMVILFLSFAFILVQLARIFQIEPVNSGTAVFLIWGLIYCTRVFLITRFGGSAGHLVLNTQLVTEDGSKLGVKQVILRDVGYLLFILIPFGYLLLLIVASSNTKKQTLVDTFTKTVLVNISPSYKVSKYPIALPTAETEIKAN